MAKKIMDNILSSLESEKNFDELVDAFKPMKPGEILSVLNSLLKDGKIEEKDGKYIRVHDEEASLRIFLNELLDLVPCGKNPRIRADVLAALLPKKKDVAGSKELKCSEELSKSIVTYLGKVSGPVKAGKIASDLLGSGTPKSAVNPILYVLEKDKVITGSGNVGWKLA